MKTVIFLPEAEQEMYEAAKFYESHSSGLGMDFIAEIERSVESIKQSPTIWPRIESELRRRLARKFPFGILYYDEPEKIVIVAVAHLKRRPGYWKNRVNF